MKGYKTKKRRRKKSKPAPRGFVTIVDHDERSRVSYSSKWDDQEDDGEEFAPVIVKLPEDKPVEKRASSFHEVVDESPSSKHSRLSLKSNGDLSPPRRRKREMDRVGRVRHDSPDGDISPPRRRVRHDSPDGDISPPRRRARHDSPDRDISPPRRRARHDSPDGDISPPRRRARHDSPSDKSSFNGDARVSKHGERHRSKEDISPPRRSRRDSVGGGGPSKRGGKRTRQDTPPRRQHNPLEDEETKEQHWGPKSLREEKPKFDPSAPFSRTIEDEALNTMYRSRDRWGDPMAKFHSEGGKKEKKDKKKKKKSTKRVCKFRAPPNRFNIPPGPHWDGVNRSNGFENDLFAKSNRAKANASDMYKWSVSDM